MGRRVPPDDRDLDWSTSALGSGCAAAKGNGDYEHRQSSEETPEESGTRLRLPDRPATSDGATAGAARAGRCTQDRLPLSRCLRQLRREACARGRLDGDRRASGDSVHRAVRLRQEHVPALPEPDERLDHRLQPRRRAALPRPRSLRPGGQPRRGPPAHRHGLPEAEPVPEVDLRQRRLGGARTSG